jgi:prepilin-type N-terminal cleavage/methylation domain-containing protein
LAKPLANQNLYDADKQDKAIGKFAKHGIKRFRVVVRNEWEVETRNNQEKTDKKAAFTLAEVLITLGVIGIVAAMTIPTLMANYQKKQTVTRLKAAYSTIANAIRLSEGENEAVTSWDFSKNTDDFVQTYLLPFIKYSQSEIQSAEFSYRTPNGTSEKLLDILSTNGGTRRIITLLNGTQIIYKCYAKNQLLNGAFFFIVDVNGYKSLPNKFGRDTFLMQIRPEAGLELFKRDDGQTGVVMKTREELMKGYSAQRYQCNNSSGRGMWCGELIRLDGWQISNDYPW